MRFRWPIVSAAAFVGLLWAPIALAEPPPDDQEEEEDPPEEPTPETGTFDPDAKPEPPRPELPSPAEDTRPYAGVGSEVAYAERGVGEFGGSLTFALTNDLTSFSADPMVGYYLWDNIELSAIVGVRHLRVNGESSNRFSLALEPSFHLPINDGLFWLVGIGNGVALGNDVDTDPSVDVGYMVSPRTGVQLLVGRSGILNLGARYSAIFSDLETDIAPLEGQAVLAFTNTFDIQAGYTVMF